MSSESFLSNYEESAHLLIAYKNATTAPAGVLKEEKTQSSSIQLLLRGPPFYNV